MPATSQSQTIRVLRQGETVFPQSLMRRLGTTAPATVSIIGSVAVLQDSMEAFLCSKDTPGATILKAFDQAAAWRDAGVCVISGFHSPLEQQCLDILLRGKQPIVWALARGMGTLRLPKSRRDAVDDGRLTVISTFNAEEVRTSANLARQRNRIVAAMATETVFAHISPGGSLERLAAEIGQWGVTVRVLQP
jgi:hypothetical protein